MLTWNNFIFTNTFELLKFMIMEWKTETSGMICRNIFYISSGNTLVSTALITASLDHSWKVNLSLKISLKLIFVFKERNAFVHPFKCLKILNMHRQIVWAITFLLPMFLYLACRTKELPSCYDDGSWCCLVHLHNQWRSEAHL